MQVPLQLTFRGMAHSDALAAHVRLRAEELERLFDRTNEIRVSQAAHGPAGARRYEYLPTYMIRGLRALNLEFN